MYIRVHLRNSYDLTQLIELLQEVPGLRLDHQYEDNDHQIIEIEGHIDSRTISTLARKTVPSLEDIGIFDPKLPSGIYGVTCLLAIYCMFEGDV